MTKKNVNAVLILLLLMSLFGLSACSPIWIKTKAFGNGTSTVVAEVIPFSIAEDEEKLNLKCELTMDSDDSGEVTVSIVETGDEEIELISDSFTESENFSFELTDVKKDTKYLIRITAVQSESVELTVVSDVKLI